jgi:ATP-dependent RNA helicase DeaD
MPPRIKNIADRYLREPERILIPAATTTVSNIEQHVVWARQRDKPLAVARLLAAEDFDATIIFTRTRESTTELADQLVDCGYSAQAINGDMNQSQREQTIALLKAGKIDVLVATDVAARGLDVERISLVINYDMPHEFDTYVHRIGRTGRAGRSGKAILLADPRDRRSVKMLEQSTRQPLKNLELPTDAEIKQRRSDRFRQTLAEKLGHADITSWQPLLEELRNELGQGVDELATGLLALLADQQGLNAKLPAAPAAVNFDRSFDRPERSNSERNSGDRNSRERGPREGSPRPDRGDRPARKERGDSNIPMDSYRMGVGRAQQIKVSDIVGAIANEAGINSSNIGRIQLFDEYSLVDLPQGMPKDILQQLKAVRVRGHMMNLSRAGESENGANPSVSNTAAPRVRRERSKAPEGSTTREFRVNKDAGADKSAPRKKIALKA